MIKREKIAVIKMYNDSCKMLSWKWLMVILWGLLGGEGDLPQLIIVWTIQMLVEDNMFGQNKINIISDDQEIDSWTL